MDYLDKDILSIQQTRDLLKRAKQAQKVLAGFTQEKIDSIVEAMAEAGYKNAAGWQIWLSMKLNQRCS